LFEDVGESIGDRCLEHHTLGLEAGQVHAYELTWFQHLCPFRGPSRTILPLLETKCKLLPILCLAEHRV